MGDQRPVLYLDLDDTLVSWANGRPSAAARAPEFVTWALERFEVRWLTTWCPNGEMPEHLLQDLARMLCIPTARLREIRGLDWAESGSKLDGIAWLEHVAGARAFGWLEDDHGFGAREREFLRQHDLLDCYHHCNVTRDASSLPRVWRELRDRYHPGTAAA